MKSDNPLILHCNRKIDDSYEYNDQSVSQTLVTTHMEPCYWNYKAWIGLTDDQQIISDGSVNAGHHPSVPIAATSIADGTAEISKQMNKLKVLSFLLLLPFLLVGCSSTYNPSIEADEAMPQLIDEGSTDEFN